MIHVEVFICYTLQHFSVCFRISSLNNAQWSVEQETLRSVFYQHLPLSCLTAKIRTHFSTWKLHVHFHPGVRRCLFMRPSYFKIYRLRIVPGLTWPMCLAFYCALSCCLVTVLQKKVQVLAIEWSPYITGHSASKSCFKLYYLMT